jgi:hypothetical protein
LVDGVDVDEVREEEEDDADGDEALTSPRKGEQNWEEGKERGRRKDTNHS